MPNLIQQETELSALLAALERAFDADEEPPTDLIREAEQMTMSVEEKRDQYAYLTRVLQHDVSFYDSEIERLKDLKVRRQRILEWLHRQVLLAMERYEVKKLAGKTSTFTRIQNPDRVEVFNVDELPPEFVAVETIKKAKKDDIKRAIKAGKVVRGALLVAGEFRLSIR